MGTDSSKHRPSSAHHPTDRPSPPGKPYLVPGSPRSDPDVITIRWDPPLFLGGCKLSGYIVEHKRTGSPYWVKATPLLVRHSQLSLSGLEPGMRYQFRVTAENVNGKSEPSPLSEALAISYSRGGVAIAPVFSSGLSDTTGTENEKVEFLVKFEGTPTPKISWFKDGFEVFSNRRQRVSTDGDLSSYIIHQVALTDEGEIKCTATNKAGHAVTKARLTLEAPPSIRLPRQYEDGLLFELGEVIRLKVSITGRPQPQVLWYHNSEQVKEGPRIEMTTSEKYASLRIEGASREDRGEYQIRAKNSIGNDVASFLVTITDRPLPPGKVEVVMTLGRCVTLAWSAPNDDGGCKIGNYIVEYFRIGWNMWLKAATCRQLTTTIGDLIEGSQYKFRVKAENPYGVSDPSQESDSVFIPDPKRGILEPPLKGTNLILDEVPSVWNEARKLHNEKRNDQIQKKKMNWPEEEDRPLPSPVILANQVLRKVKLAPQRTWSEDSQGSPPRDPPPPVPPKRKNRTSTITEESESPPPPPLAPKPPQKTVSPVVTPQPSNYFEKIPEGRPSVWKKETEWGRELSPSSPNADDVHSSSEMMLVLLPNDSETNEESDQYEEMRMAKEELKGKSVAPPMSLSAPVLGGSPPPATIRAALSSSELLYELALARFNKEVDDEETERNVEMYAGVSRKRSFEKKQKKTGEFKLETASTEDLADPPRKSSESSNEGTRFDEFSDRFTMLEKSYEDYSQRYNFDDHRLSSDLESIERSFDYTEDEVDEPYQVRESKGVFTPITIQMPVMEFPERVPSPQTSVPMITISEEPEEVAEPEVEVETIVVRELDLTPSPSPERSRFERSPSPKKKAPEARKLSEPEEIPKMPKPILKVRDRSVDRSEDGETHMKKVRIEAPEDKESIDKYAHQENGLGLAAGEVARNRRKNRPQTNGEDADPTRVVVSLYSDIVKEFGQPKKPQKLYLSYDELKAAADKTPEPVEAPVAPATPPDPPAQLDTVPQTLPEKPRNLYTSYIMDLFMFLVACWLYLFKDPKLSIPILVLMVCRQIHEALRSKIGFNWRKKKQ